MKATGRYLTVASFLLLLASMGCQATPDPLAANSGDFLDVNLSALEGKAAQAYQAGRYEDAAKAYLELLHYDVADAGSIYNLACCYGLLGRGDLAAKDLERAFKAGYDDVEHARRDEDFDKVRSAPEFAAVMERAGKVVEARGAMAGKVVYVPATTLQPCYVHLPENFDAAKSYRLVVALHGYGSNADRFAASLWPKVEHKDFIFAAPRGPYTVTVGKQPGYSWYAPLDRREAGAAEASKMADDYVAAVIGELSRKYKVSEVYLMGFSQGGAMTYKAGLARHDLLKGIICMGAQLDPISSPPEMIDAAKGLRVFIGHGNKDNVVPYQFGTTARDTLKQHGYDVTFFDFDGAHAVPKEAVKAIEEWLEKKP